MHIQKVLGVAFFYRTTPVATFEVSFSTRKQFFKKENKWGYTASALSDLFHVQRQEPASSTTTTRAFVFLAKLIITKYLKEGVDEDLSVCVDERYPCGLSIARDIDLSKLCNLKVMTLLPQCRRAP